MQLNSQAVELNRAIEKTNKNVYDMLSKRGRAIFFPKLGIPSQAADAAKTEINATIGMALEENGETMCLDSIAKKVDLPKAQIFNYAKGAGVPTLREKWSEMLRTKNPSLEGKNISKPVVTAALTNGISLSGYLFIDTNDEIIVPDNYWGNYNLAIENTWNGTLKHFKMFTDNGKFNVVEMKNTLLNSSKDKVVVVLNFPNNPTGYTPTEAEAIQIRDALVEVAESGKNVLALIDDAYFGLVYKEGVIKESIFVMLTDAHEKILAVKLDGPTKEDYVWGFRVGFITFGCKVSSPELYSALEWKLTGAIRGTVSNISNIGQNLLLQSYNSENYKSEKEDKYNILKARYDEVVRILENHKEYSEIFTPLPFNSGYFMCVKVTDGLSADALRKQLIDKYGVGTVAIGNLIRIAYSAIPKGDISKVFSAIYSAGKDLI